ncbi:hypothetical protein CDG76_28065 [Nostoc sp. 'Peltigera membranacea cyanobiont' 210A]|uniref:hypothetical protein n=1 Tax=Nostoc sp. 'Peltigera membranacea cyanobiont' 210A TaxID=2014529 RepID=UPI000B95C1DC|nr:hypothetical protein [Nostoc sp. 'Peltigera membranacea cyanobiont' 210A]OYD91113.1 hypothetical protein CDG76_28065 [Nostoc sp. 'Peltigera membranacea cyanobiont' 210A]
MNRRLYKRPICRDGDLSRLFVGRKDELHAIASRMKGDQPTSINSDMIELWLCTPTNPEL